MIVKQLDSETTEVERTEFNLKMRKEFERIQASNAGFKRASKRQKRILVAKDAIEWVKLGLFDPVQGTYFEVERVGLNDRPSEFWKESPPKQLHEQILERVDEDSNCCRACGIGGLLVAKCMRFDEVEVKTDLDVNFALPQRACSTGLEDLFSREQLAMIEVAFEVWKRPVMSAFAKLAESERIAAARFGGRFKSSKTRFIGIMNNIIKNDGTFKP